ncbi:MAG: SpoIIIAC/SpoIIIAD family protein [Clostridia bacterium]
MDVLKLFGIALIGTVFSLIIKSYRPELALCVALATGAFIFVYVLSYVIGIAEDIKNAVESYGLNTSYLEIVFKAIGIAYLAQFAADAAKDAGEGAIAGKVELMGRLMVLSVALPSIVTLLATVSGLLSGNTQ